MMQKRHTLLACLALASAIAALDASAAQATGYYAGAASRDVGRPEPAHCLKAMRDGDTLTVWRLDRLGRSLQDLVRIVADLEGRGVHFESISEKIETGTAARKPQFHVFAALAEFERGLIRERTAAGLAAARARGRKGGRKPKLTGKQISMIRALLRDPSMTVPGVAREYGVSRTTTYKHVGTVKPRAS